MFSPRDGRPSPSMPRRRARSGVPWAMLPRQITESGLDDACVRLYAELDSYLHDLGKPVRGADRIARRMGWSGRKLTDHSKHLIDCGLIEVVRNDRKQIGMIVVHNPAVIGRDNPLAAIPPRPDRYRKRSTIGRAAPRGRRDLPSLDVPRFPRVERPASNADTHPRGPRPSDARCPSGMEAQSVSLGSGGRVCAVCRKPVRGHPFDDHEPLGEGFGPEGFELEPFECDGEEPPVDLGADDPRLLQAPWDPDAWRLHFRDAERDLSTTEDELDQGLHEVLEPKEKTET